MTMTDLRERFARTDDLPAPDLWLDIERKVSAPSKRPPHDTLRRLVTIAAAFVIAIAAGALLLRAFDRGERVVPLAPAPSSNEITFSFDHPGVAVDVNGVEFEGVVFGPPVMGMGPVALFEPDQPVVVPAGARIVVDVPAAFDGVDVRGSIDDCCDSIDRVRRAIEEGQEINWTPPRLYELDLTDGAVMPVAPGRYVVELGVEWPIKDGGGYTYLFPVRVVATEGDESS
jgi:hypothetical protein